MSSKSRQEDEQVYTFICEYLEEQQQQASAKQISAACGISVPSATQSIARLQKAGRLREHSTVPTNYAPPTRA